MYRWKQQFENHQNSALFSWNSLPESRRPCRLDLLHVPACSSNNSVAATQLSLDSRPSEFFHITDSQQISLRLETLADVDDSTAVLARPDVELGGGWRQCLSCLCVNRWSARPRPSLVQTWREVTPKTTSVFGDWCEVIIYKVSFFFK